MSRAGVGVVGAHAPKFADETRALLQTRIKAAANISAGILGFAFVGNLIIGSTELVWLRAVLLALVAGTSVVSHRKPTCSMRQLRTMELIVFGSLFGQVTLMMVTRLAGYAASEDGPSVIAVRDFHVAAWCVLLLSYGIFIPNTWKRGSAIILPLAVAPYVVLHFHQRISPEVDSFLSDVAFETPVPLTLVAAAIAIYGSHVINSVRREAFKAKQFGQYRLGDRLGGGGMGVVHRAEHVLLKRPCAIKLIKPENEADTRSVADFEKEVKATARLTHWNTIEIFDYGRTDDGTFYYVMELLPGRSLEELIERHGALDPPRVLFLLLQICDALEEAHSVGLIHRDLKPANIFVTRRGCQFDVAKLLDFGLVKERQSDETNESTRLLSGTPLYMSPEQATSYDEVDGRSDIYSLGCVAYHLLTGQPPFTGESVLSILAAHRQETAAPLREIFEDISEDLQRCVLKCLEKQPDDRFQEVGQFAEALRSCQLASRWSNADAQSWWRAYEPESLD